MRRQRDRAPVPAGWQRELDEKADLEASFAALAGCRHFYADTLRGRIRSLQMRPKGAALYLSRALLRASRALETVPVLIRQSFATAYLIENAILEGPIEPGMDLPPSWLPDLPEEFLRDHPEVRAVLECRRLTQALVRLHAHDAQGAAEQFEEALHSLLADQSETRVRALIGHAAALSAMDETGAALGRLEAAGLELQLTASTLTRAWQGSTLAAAYEYLALSDEAQTCHQFVEALPCPEATKTVFRRRGDRMLRRSRKARRMMVL